MYYIKYKSLPALTCCIYLKAIFYIFIVLLFFYCLDASASSNVNNKNYTDRYLTSLQTSYRNDFGDGMGHVEAIIPFAQNHSNLLFGYANTFTELDDAYGYGVGIGFRHLYNNKIVFGGYTLIDRQRTDLRNHLYQGAIGFEALAEKWDFRINYDLPEDHRTYLDNESKVIVSGNNLFSKQAKARTMHGGNIEIGYKLPWGFVTNNIYDTRVYVGTLYSDASNIDSITSPYSSFEIRFNNPNKNLLRLSLSAGSDFIWEDTDEFESSYFFRATLPLGKKYSSVDDSHNYLTAKDRMVEHLRRRRIKIREERYLEDLSPISITYAGSDISGIYFAEEGATGVGTEPDPTSLTTALSLAGTNGIIVAKGDAGNIVVGSTGAFGGAVMQQGQILLGGGSSIVLQTSEGRPVAYTASGSRPKLINDVPTDFVVLNAAQDSLIKGVEIDGDSSFGGMIGGSYGLYAESVTNVTVEDVNFKNLDYGTYFYDSSGTISNNLYEDIALWAIRVDGVGATGNVTVQNNTFQGSIGSTYSLGMGASFKTALGLTSATVGGGMALYGDLNIDILNNNISVASNFLIGIYAQTDAGQTMNMMASDNIMNLPIFYSAGFSVYNTGGAGIMNLSGTGNEVDSNPSSAACAPLFFPGTGPTTSTLEVNGMICY